MHGVLELWNKWVRVPLVQCNARCDGAMTEVGQAGLQSNALSDGAKRISGPQSYASRKNRIAHTPRNQCIE